MTNSWTARRSLMTSCVVAAGVIFLTTSPALANPLSGPNWSTADKTGFCGDVNGGNVVAAEEFLRDRGLYSDAIDGAWGPHANTSLITFQANNGLSGDGCAGSMTWAKMQLRSVYSRTGIDRNCTLPNQSLDYYHVPPAVADSYVYRYPGIKDWLVFVNWPSANGWTRFHPFKWQDAQQDWVGCA